MKRYYCTYFDRNYLVKGLALIESLKNHEKNDFELFIICMDEITRVILKKLGLPNVTLIPMHEIEQRDFPLLATKKDRTLIEYYFTSTPAIILRLLERNSHIDILTYIDSDLYLFSSPDPIFEELDNNSVLIHEHRFSPSLRHLEIYGKYNVGLLCFRNNVNGIKVLNWWREKCIEWCFNRLENEKYADQKYLNDWTTLFDEVAVLQNVGAGVAPWNHEQYDYSVNKSGDILVNNKPLVFYHFHSLAFVIPEIVVPVKFMNYVLTLEILRLCFLPYIDMLHKKITVVRTVVADFIFGLHTENILSTQHTFLAKSSYISELKKISLPQIQVHLNNNWTCYCSEQLKEFPDIKTKTILKPDDSQIETSEDINRLLYKINKFIEETRFDEAFLLLKQSLENHPDSPDLLNLHGVLKRRTGDKEGAKTILLGIISRWPTYAKALNSLGVIYWEEGSNEKAAEYFSRAFQADPNDKDIILNVGKMLISQRQYEIAKQLYHIFLNRKPDVEEIREALRNLERDINIR